PFYLNTRARPWIRDGAHPRRASVSSFGFGGSNFHVTLEEYVPSGANGQEAWRYRTTPTELVLLGDSTARALVARCRTMASDGGGLVRIARESQERFNAADRVRLSIVAASAPDLAEKLTTAAAAIEKSPDQSFLTATGTSYSAAVADAGGVAF